MTCPSQTWVPGTQGSASQGHVRTKQASVLSWSFLESSAVKGRTVRVDPAHWASVVWGMAPVRYDLYDTQLSCLKYSIQVLKVDSHGGANNTTISSRIFSSPKKDSGPASSHSLPVSRKLITTHLPLCIWWVWALQRWAHSMAPFLPGFFKEHPVSRLPLQYE